MKKTSSPHEPARSLTGRVLARVLAEDLKEVGGEGTTKSVGCGRGCDEIINDSFKLSDDQV